MKKIVSMLALATLATATSANAAVIINEVYSGGGSSSATAAFTRDYVELYNTGTTAVNLTGYRLTYASATGNFGTNDVITFGTGSSIGSGDYLLLVTGAAGTGGAAIVGANYYATNPTTGAPAGASLAATAGSVTLLNGTTQVDTVGFGTTTTSPDAAGLIKFETAAAPAASSIANTISRNGFADTNNNSVDFTSQATSPTAGTRSTAVPAAVPEPTTLAAIAGLGLLGGLRRRRA